MKTFTCAFALLCIFQLAAAEEEKFVFPTDRPLRDPFTFAMLQDQEPGPHPFPRPHPVPPDTARSLDDLANRAESALADREIDKALTHCADGFAILRELRVDDLPALIAVSRERLMRIHTAAARIRQRAKVEELFSKQTITVSGIVAGDRKSHALINGSLAAAGQVVQTKEGDAVVVESIRHNEVLLRFRGYLFSVPLESATR
jgi:hypothetical protein